ncbi:MAG: hypothetical protein WCP14_03905 [bacterium]
MNTYKFVQLGCGASIYFAVLCNGKKMKGLRSENYEGIQKKLAQYLRITTRLHSGKYKVIPIN